MAGRANQISMRLTRVQATNLKGRSFDYPLGPLQLITGDNFTGKTAVIEAIRLALLGHIPEIGKRATDTWSLSSGPEMSVSVHMDDGTTRGLSLHIEGTSTKILLNMGGKDNGVFDIPLLDSEHYFGLTDKQRIEYVFSRITLPADYTVDGIIARLQRLNFEEGHTEEIEKAKQEAIARVQQTIKGATIPLSQSLIGSKETMATDFTYWNKRAKETQGAVAILTELKNRQSEVSAERLKDLEGQIAEKQTRVRIVTQERGTVLEQMRSWEKALVERQKMEVTLKKPVLDHSEKIASHEKTIAGHQQAITELPKPGAVDLAIDKGRQLLSDLVTFESQRNIATDAIASAETKLKELNSLQQCPYCRSKDKGWQSEIEHHYKKIIEAGKVQIAALWKLIDETKATYGEQKVEAERLQAMFRRGEDALVARESLKNQIEHLRFEETTYRSQYVELEERFEASHPLPEKPNADALEIELSGLEQQLRELTVKHKTAIQLQQDLKRAAQSALEHETAKAHVTVIKAIGKELTTIQSEMIDRVFGGLLKNANHIVGDILRSPLAFHQGEVGRWTDDCAKNRSAGMVKFIPHGVFSGTEKALTYIAISAALSIQAPLRLLILDEIGRLDTQNREKIATALAQAVNDKLIDQAIVVGTDLHGDVRDWNVLRLP